MKVAVTSLGEGLDSKVDTRFGRAKYYVLYDTETKETETIDNSVNMNASHGAGIQAAEAVANTGASVLITGNVGPNAFRSLDAVGIKVFTGADGDTVREAIAKYERGELGSADGANVEGHW
ncbi:MAG: dinitrogenase iron-molybdenum cofactor biosynthesis protein [Candidatus Latescibacteria bacterium 4484_7]|nr:MAG: dinitrogenase iron-molybdenum cofactor biosynthesis protein [Candidatus Latescibacteria bacterium 4484_7]